MGTVVAGDPRIYQRRVKTLDHQNGATHSHLFNLVPDWEPPTKNSEASELVLGCKSGGQAHGPALTEPANNDSILGNSIADLLCDELVYLVPGLKDPGFVLWTFEPKTEDIKPEHAELVPKV